MDSTNESYFTILTKIRNKFCDLGFLVLKKRK